MCIRARRRRHKCGHYTSKATLWATWWRVEVGGLWIATTALVSGSPAHTRGIRPANKADGRHMVPGCWQATKCPNTQLNCVSLCSCHPQQLHTRNPTAGEDLRGLSPMHPAWRDRRAKAVRQAGCDSGMPGGLRQWLCARRAATVAVRQAGCARRAAPGGLRQAGCDRSKRFPSPGSKQVPSLHAPFWKQCWDSSHACSAAIGS
eukprot:364782-Chlamydomonas_euryale.AAC.13